MAEFITWLDIEREVKRKFKFKNKLKNIKAIYCYSSGMEVEYINEKELAISDLNEIFNDSIVRKEDELLLFVEIGGPEYFIELIPAVGEKKENNIVYPLWREHVYVENTNFKQPEQWGDGPKFCAFHSFKGGVGRTTSLMTYASAALDNDNIKKILLIDGDLEAPGLTLWLDAENLGKVTYTNFLEAIQFSEGKFDATIDFFAKELRKSSISIDGNSKEIFVLPSALSLESIMDMPVTPDHISKNIDNPYILSDLLRLLGNKLEVDVILIDLRAGLSELSSPLIFDPRVEHFFVSTIAKQSVVGIGEVLKKIHNSIKNSHSNVSDKPTVIISMLTKLLRESTSYTEAIQIVNEAYPAIEDEDIISQSIELLEFDFDENLMSVSNIKDALSLLRKSSIYDNAKDWIADVELMESTEGNEDSHGNDSGLQRLYDTCQSFQFAENTSGDDMLVIDPIRNLAKNYADSLPNVVSIGAKGAGKTFTYLQVCKSKTWSDFIFKVNSNVKPHIHANILPWISSTNLNEKVREQVAEQRAKCLTEISAQSPRSLFLNVKRITDALASDSTNWDDFWQDLLVSEIVGDNKNLKDLNDHLIAIDKSIVLLVDGIEDILFAPEKDANHNSAIRSLLNLPNAISDLQNRRIGLVCFVRADYVQSAIKQNVNQYVAKYQQFRLEWTPESFLRLAYWISAKAEIINANELDAESGSLNFLLSNLERLWGKKLGRDNSKEASSARWVFAALCDLNGRLQARDLVRFLKFSADNMLKAPSNGIKVEFWLDRLLAPEAIRRSLNSCSQEKVDEAEKEIKPLEQWISNLKTVSPDLKKVPFNPQEVGLDLQLLTSLKELGVIYEDTDQPNEERFYLPEIYRTGLQFSSAVGGRPRVQALLKRNLGGIPF
ncbi:ParA family protein [Salmonella enterica]|uniref:ParA family protein n=1 Tax=Enterobacteriaceae TaxID=543 RepID=UPI000FA0D9A8|nr:MULTISPECIES: ParA family protein [Enterobacteriaceae]EBY1890581.1 ParA family protein [Salmonella enterica subsp. enterica serovar Welikade]ECI8167163.1 ParA family protein [Salmonella enterica subsp. enterica serovar Java]EDO6522441.1 ParA family protein [Salmonella enterica subsp. enterica serovar 4,[5],12:b:-]EEC0850999.1 ParA family protein [Salmonella enterica subsp. enterica]EKR1606592.1 ParA family protein [Salmonella enterica subsp. enterica serovar Stanley]